MSNICPQCGSTRSIFRQFDSPETLMCVWCDATWDDDTPSETETLRAENERLRTLLQTITNEMFRAGLADVGIVSTPEVLKAYQDALQLLADGTVQE